MSDRHDPAIEAAALAMLRRLGAKLPDDPTLADVARVRAQAVRLVNITAVKLFVEEVLSGKRTYKAVREVTVEQLQAMERALTQYNDRVTRKAVLLTLGIKLPRPVRRPDAPAEAPTLETLNTRTGPPRTA